MHDRRVREIEHGTFTPLVLSTTGGMGKAATTFYERLASFLSDKRDENYSHTMGWLRCRLSFALLRSSIMCIRGARSSFNRPILDSPINLQLDGRLSDVLNQVTIPDCTIINFPLSLVFQLDFITHFSLSFCPLPVCFYVKKKKKNFSNVTD